MPDVTLSSPTTGSEQDHTQLPVKGTENDGGSVAHAPAMALGALPVLMETPRRVAIDLRNSVYALHKLQLPSPDMPTGAPHGKRVRNVIGGPRLTMAAGEDHLRLRLERHQVTAEITIPLIEPVRGAGEIAFDLADSAIFDLLSKSQLESLERKAHHPASTERPAISFVLDTKRPALTLMIGRARYQLNVSLTDCPPPLKVLESPINEIKACDPAELAKALDLAATFKLPESASSRQEASRLNMISCAAGIVRGGTATGFTFVKNSLLEPFEFSLHRRDSRVLAHFLRRIGKCTVRVGDNRVQFENENCIVEVERGCIDFPDYEKNIEEFESAATRYPAMAVDVVYATLIQSIVQATDTSRHPFNTTVAFDACADGNIYLRSRSADGRNEGKARVDVQGARQLPNPLYVSVAVRDLLRAMEAPGPGSQVAVMAVANTLSIVVADNERTVQHFIAASSRPPLILCRDEIVS